MYILCVTKLEAITVYLSHRAGVRACGNIVFRRSDWEEVEYEVYIVVANESTMYVTPRKLTDVSASVDLQATNGFMAASATESSGAVYRCNVYRCDVTEAARGGLCCRPHHRGLMEIQFFNEACDF